MDLGIGNFGCMHYKRRCKIRAPCCSEIFDCRHCHNEAKNADEINPLDRHDIPRHQVKKVQQYCINCGVCMGKYLCATCKFFDDDISKNQYHCDGCGICRTGGKDNFFHCKRCGCCYSKVMKDAHRCVEKAMHHNCPVCFEIASTPMPDIYKDKLVWILCNDCGANSEVEFHIVAHKCPSCNSYNTRQI